MFFTGGGSGDFMLKVWNLNTKSLIQEKNTGSQICSIFSAKHTNDIYTGHGHPSNSINVWRVKGLKKVVSLKEHSKRVLYLEQSPSGERFLSASPDETMCFWSTLGEGKRKELQTDSLSKHSILR